MDWRAPSQIISYNTFQIVFYYKIEEILPRWIPNNIQQQKNNLHNSFHIYIEDEANIHNQQNLEVNNIKKRNLASYNKVDGTWSQFSHQDKKKTQAKSSAKQIPVKKKVDFLTRSDKLSCTKLLQHIFFSF